MAIPVSTISSIFGLVGGSIGITFGLLNVRSLLLRLQVRVKEVEVVGVEGRSHLVLLRLAFVNPGTTNKTIYDLAMQFRPGEARITDRIPYRYNDSYSRLMYWLPNDPEIKASFAINELPLLPFDVPAQQSRSFWKVLMVELMPGQRWVDGIPTIWFRMEARDSRGRRLNSFQSDIQLDVPRTPVRIKESIVAGRD